MSDDPKCYTGGNVDYVDYCCVDEMSLLEISSMLKEVGSVSGAPFYWYKLSGTSMDSFYELQCDADVLEMCHLVTGIYVDVYVSTMLPVVASLPHLSTQNIDYADEQYDFSQPEVHFRDFEFVDTTQNEIRDKEQIKEMFGSDCTDNEDSDYEFSGSEDSVSEDGDYEAFHSDNSNRDESDDDLIFDAHVDNLEPTKDKFDGETGGGDESGDSSTEEKFDSDIERMVENSTDDDDGGYPVYNEDTMVNPVFENGMCFKDSLTFRCAVKRHAILERRPIVNVRNFGKKVKYVCQKPCKWQIYASTMQKTSTYQIKTSTYQVNLKL